MSGSQHHGPSADEPDRSEPHAGAREEMKTRRAEELRPDLELIRTLEEGDTATVYLAREPALKRLVAVKVLAPNLAEDGVARRRFEREARSAASISHPSVVTIYRVGRLPDGLPFQVMEYVKGKSLAEHVEAMGRLSIGEGRRVLLSVASALEAAHEHHIVHRDVRAGNVLREDATGRVLLADFGIAAVLASGSETVERLTRTGELLGDVRHASPEQLRGEEPSEQTDLYGLALLAYEIFTGDGPFEAESPQELTVAHLRGEPRRLADLRPEVPAGLDEIFVRCLAKNPRHRPTAAQVVDRLESREDAAEGPAEAGVGGRTPAAGTGERPRASPAVDARTGGGWTRPGAGEVREAPPVQHISGLKGFYRELKRRHVFRVALVYGAVAWVVVQVAASTFPHLNLPSWAVTLVIVLALAGFPFSLVMAWAFEMTPEGVRKTPPREGEDAPQADPRG